MYLKNCIGIYTMQKANQLTHIQLLQKIDIEQFEYGFTPCVAKYDSSLFHAKLNCNASHLTKVAAVIFICRL